MYPVVSSCVIGPLVDEVAVVIVGLLFIVETVVVDLVLGTPPSVIIFPRNNF